MENMTIILEERGFFRADELMGNEARGYQEKREDEELVVPVHIQQGVEEHSEFYLP